MPDGTWAGRGISHCCGFLLRRCDHIREIVERERRVGRDNVGRGTDQQNRFEIILHVEGRLIDESRNGGMRVKGDEESRTVR